MFTRAHATPRGLLLLMAWILVSAGHSAGAANYPLGRDSEVQEGVPKGRLIDGKHLSEGSLFPGTQRAYTVYLPAGFDPREPAPLMVFQDGRGLAESWRVPIVLDNLIHRHELPPMIGVFVSPGVLPPLSTNELPRFNRSYEYDSLGDRYARFLVEEFLPYVEHTHQVRFSQDPAARGIAGASSGAMAAFNAAWERPDAFSRVLSTIGTYVGLRGGDALPVLIRKTEPRGLRVFLQDGSNDLDIYGGNWWLANQQMFSALEFAGYEVKAAWGDGGHDGRQAAAVLPEAMRWLWKDFPKAPARSSSSRNTFLGQILLPGKEWELVSEGHSGAACPVAGLQGEVYFADPPNDRILRIDSAGKVAVFASNTGGAGALAVGADGRLLALAVNQGRLLRFDATGSAEVMAEEVRGFSLAILPKGIYVADADNRSVVLLPPRGATRLFQNELSQARSLIFSPDQRLLYLADAATQWVWSFALSADGTPTQAQPYFHLHVPDRILESGALGMTVDADGRLYVATHLGIQVCDQAGRVNAILPAPDRGSIRGLCLGGPNLASLYAAVGERVYRRPVAVRGIQPSGPALRPAPPRL